MGKIDVKVLLGILSVVGAFLIHLTFGHFYTIANMAPYIMAYLRKHSNPSLKDSQTVWFSASTLGIQGIVMPLGGMVAKRFGYRFVVCFSCLAASLGIILTFFTIKTSFATVVLTYSLMNGAGYSFGYSVVLAAAASWFPARKGLVMGIVVGGFGLGSLVFAPVQKALINPDNLKVDNVTRQFTDEKVLHRIPPAFIAIGTILLSIQCLGMVFLREKKALPKQPEDNTNEGATVREEKASSSKPNKPKDGQSPAPKDQASPPEKQLPQDENISPKQLLKNMDFYLLWCVMFCAVIPISMFTSTYKYFGQVHITDDQYLTMVVTISALFNFGGRIMWGAIVDRISFKVPICTALGTWAIFLFTFPYLGKTTGMTVKVLFAIWVCTQFMCLSGIFSIMPTATGSLFGTRNLAVNYGMIFTAFAFGSLLSMALNMLLSGTYDVLFSTAGIMCLCALFAILWIEDRNIPRIFSFCNLCISGRSRCQRRKEDSPQ